MCIVARLPVWRIVFMSDVQVVRIGKDMLPDKAFVKLIQLTVQKYQIFKSLPIKV